MFWGLIMEPNKRYTQVVQRSFHISMAALDCSSDENSKNVQVLVGINEKNFLLCNLNSQNLQQSPLDLNFQSGDKIAFMHSGTGYVHLTGYLVPEDDLDEMFEEAEDEEAPELVKPNKKNLKRKSSDDEEIKTKKKKLPTADLLEALAKDSDDDESFVVESIEEESEDSDDADDEDDNDNEDEAGDEEAEDEEESDEDDNDESDDDDDESEDDEEEQIEVPVEKKKESKKDKKQKMQNGTVSPKKDKKQINKSKGANQESPKDKNKKEENQQKKDKTKKKNNKDGKKNDKGDDKKDTTDKENKPLKKVIEGGVHIEDLKVGSGPVAKPGRFVQVYYEGRLKSNGKQFDASKTGPGFKFRLGKKEVIQGWDVGVAGMRVGGKRRITCPPNMAYGAKGSPPVIPPNSTLVFEVELRSVN